jgi:hypothetical protein
MVLIVMPPTLEDLDSRLRQLEQQVARLNERLQPHARLETRAERGTRLIITGLQSQPLLAAGWSKVLQRLGIAGEPIAAERLQEMIAAQGFRPETNEFSQTIIEMREE